jgi:hypothetical protein
LKSAQGYVTGLLDLPAAESRAEARMAFRAAMLGLARGAEEAGPGVLEGVDEAKLIEAVQLALGSGLFDDLDWMAAPAAGVALYTLATALPAGQEQRELGRRVLARLHGGNTATFCAMAEQMAKGSAKALSTPAVRARIALTFELPLASVVGDGRLALAIVAKKELASEWVHRARTGSLNDRRLAARILERAAREAARRASQGDLGGVRTFQSDAVQSTISLLLADREGLVWRGVAVVRGLLAPFVPEWQAELEHALDPSLSPTEWRRGATSLAARAALEPEAAFREFPRMVAVAGRDPGVYSAFVWGLPRAIEAEPDAAESLVDRLCANAPPYFFAEALLDARNEFGPHPIFANAAIAVVTSVGSLPTPADGEDDSALTVLREVVRDLQRTSGAREDEPLRDQVRRAVTLFASDGAGAAGAEAKGLLEGLTAAVEGLATTTAEEEREPGRAGALARRTQVAALRDVEAALLETFALPALLHLAPNASDARAYDADLDGLRERVADWIIARESSMADGAHLGLHFRRLRALLRLADGDVAEDDGKEEVRQARPAASGRPTESRRTRHRARWVRITKALLSRFLAEPPQALRRTILAALARALDALVRTEASDRADAFLLLALHVPSSGDLATLAEASLDPDLEAALVHYARFSPRVDALLANATEGDPEGANATRDALLSAFEKLSEDLFADVSGRGDALRGVIARLASALRTLASAPSLRALANGTDGDPLERLETALLGLAQMCATARSRFEAATGLTVPPPSASLRALLAGAVARADSEQQPLRSTALREYIEGGTQRIPRAIRLVVQQVVLGLARLRLDVAAGADADVERNAEPLPSWLPPRRTLGGFYVLRALGAGAVGSVFLTSRVEERHEPDAERFALKVPDYSENAARALSEQEFLELFRAEASALLGVPPHRNLARFVTFDAGAKPKPILVMEYVEGTTLERALAQRSLTASGVFEVLGQVLDGLASMHGVGVAHLDIKPSNIILREQEGGGVRPVIVDFGLAGRKLRAGCATGNYGAPEIWSATTAEAKKLSPLAADVYAFGCLTYELFTGETLFDGPNDMAIIARHLAHDGLPPGLRELQKRREAEGLVELLFGALRRDPAARSSVADLQRDFARLARSWRGQEWPLL